MAARPPIPKPIQRKARQSCGFGCVLCGMPLYEYHHIDLNPKNNVESNITLLCDTHHKEVTNGLLSHEQVNDAHSRPYNYNVQHGISSPYGLHFQGKNIECVIGGNTFLSSLGNSLNATTAIAVSVDDTDLIGFRIDYSGGLFLNANIFDENNIPILVIHDNALAYRSATWDIEFKGRVLIVREAARKILFEIEFLPPNQIAIKRARLLCNGVEILVRTSYIFIVNSQQLFRGTHFYNCEIGIQIGRNLRGLRIGCTTEPENVCRYHMPATEVQLREQQALKYLEGTWKDLEISLDS